MFSTRFPLSSSDMSKWAAAVWAADPTQQASIPVIISKFVVSFIVLVYLR